jgi:hypothetical protein
MLDHKKHSPIPEDNPPLWIRMALWLNEHTLAPVLLALNWLYWKLRLRWILPGLALLVIIWLSAFYALESWMVKEKIVTVAPFNYVRVAKAAEPEQPKYSIDQIVDAVHILESSGGVKDGCIAKGKINGFGFAQHGSRDVWNCYKNYAQVRALVEQWFAEKVPDMGEATALCYYNLGKKVDDCDYYRRFQIVVRD